ncbi:protein kinase domain-containing protein [Planctomycetes bacterium K23_9]|uniref:Serine/threonine-protein kinase PrkC n=1 Tax=Stieleria marina TaxID=1930275 RepID=A0A517NQZ5_9BACT|nr:Serine/threonine-protein kinase PrkC [Planctomycetes bacterium K23_9]
MHKSIEAKEDSLLELASLLLCYGLAVAVIATMRIEVAILLMGTLSLMAYSGKRRFWVCWSLALLATIVATGFVFTGAISDAWGMAGETGPTWTQVFSGPSVAWVAACLVLMMQAIMRLQKEAHEAGQIRFPVADVSPLSVAAQDVGQQSESANDSQMTFELADDIEMLDATDMHSSIGLHAGNVDKIQHSRFSLEATEVEELVQTIGVAGDFDQDQLQLIDDSLKRAVFKRESDVADLLPPGSQVGQYTIEKLLNQGGGGRVYVASHNESDQLVALKILKSRKLDSRFRREMSLVQKLAHPNIVVAYEVDEHCGVPYIVMELLSGTDLHAHVRDEGPVPYVTSLNWMLQAARALSHADERGLTHRDVKPGNLIQHRDNVLKLTDLGLAVFKTADRDSLSNCITRDAAVVGTLEFMAPEQAKSLASADVRSDIFGLGATWYYLLAGHSHLSGSNLKEQLTALLVDRNFIPIKDGLIPPRAMKILERMTAYDPADRFQAWDDVIAAILSLSDDSDSHNSPSVQVLLIEDNADDVVLTTRMLGEMNHSVVVHEASTLAEATELLTGPIAFDLILLDLQLPDSMGIETVHAVRQVDSTSPLVVLSGFGDTSTGLACEAAGANAYTRKNALDVHELERIIFVTRSRFEANVAVGVSKRVV